MHKRWRIERAGLVNFWLYDEAEFIFSSGRLILRGANGSGKSVTMQSLVPLVLDGDKRPWRLDPFGSRDRRIEYYLLGDADSGIVERTGYLYLEFYHPDQERHLTIGIGLRARRSTPVSFWGFAITDNRRIGRDLFLYERDFSHGKEAHIPLTRPQLEEAIGTGGWVVTEQSEYKRRVNNLLFGYEDLESYDEPLDLLIQVRSPKLSKDFKPSTIYEILTSALPPLLEDDLRPLAEVLGDMNEIGDRLAELSVHRQEAERLSRAYAQYNEYQLFAASQVLRQSWQERQEKREEEAAKRGEIETLTREQKQHQEKVAEAQQRLLKIRAEYETLSASEVLDKERELERLSAEAKETDRALELARGRLQRWQQNLTAAKETSARYRPELEKNEGQQRRLLNEMEKLAGESELLTHAAYHSYWETAIPGAGEFWPSWRKDLKEREAALEHAHRLARAESALKREVENAERDLSAARELRDRREAALRAGEEAAERARARLQEEIFTWKKELKYFILPDQVLHEVLSRLARYDELPYSDVQAPVADAYQEAALALHRARVEKEHERRQHLAAKEEFLRQYREWQARKEPEPPRSETREASRRRRRAAGEQGAPLYAACEFRPDLPEETRAALEAALQQAGLLDAWITGNGLALASDEEEVWIEPRPQLLAYTLADYLIPTPPEGSGLTAEAIDAVLRTIRVGQGREHCVEGCIGEDGTFRLGCLFGQVAPKPRAEYIGKESRRRTRQAEMERLQGLIEAEDRAIRACDAELDKFEQEEAALTAEFKAFPSGQDLQNSFRELERLRSAFESARSDEERKFEQHQALLKKWATARAELHQFMAGWALPRTEAALEQALRALRTYDHHLSDLRRLWEGWRNLQETLAEARRRQLEAEEQLVQEQEQVAALLEKQQAVQTRIKTLEELLRELGAYDLHARLHQLKEEEEQLGQSLQRENKLLNQIEIKLAVCQKELQGLAAARAEAEAVFRERFKAWQLEWGRRLLPEWANIRLDPGDETAAEKICREISRRYRHYESSGRDQMANRLYQEFHGVRQTLHPYVPELQEDPANGRLLVVFLRDRQNPISPGMLLAELKRAEEEQRLLLSEKDRELYEEVLIHSVGRAIKQKIARAEHWVSEMNRLMQARETSSGLKLSLRWEPRAAQSEDELDTAELVRLLRTDPHLLREDQLDRMVRHFCARIKKAQEEAEAGETLRDWVARLLDYRQWFRFTLYYEKGEQPRRELTDARFNVLSGGEKAMAMYIPLFAAVYSRYSDASPAAPHLISLDEAFAGVDEENLRDMFDLLTQMDLDYIMTSQHLWGCYDTVPAVSIYELYRPKDAPYVSLIRYIWNGRQRTLAQDEPAMAEAAATSQTES